MLVLYSRRISRGPSQEDGRLTAIVVVPGARVLTFVIFQISVLERCVEPLLLLELPPFEHPMVEQLRLRPSKGQASSSSSLLRRLVPQEPDTWVLLLIPSAEENDSDMKKGISPPFMGL